MTNQDAERNEKRVSFRRLVDLPSTTFGTFGLYRYPAKFIPHIVAYVVKQYARPGDSLFDPFAGYGTVGTVARVYDHPYELWDLSPLLEALHRTTLTRPRQFEVRTLVRRVVQSDNEFVPDWSNFQFWFHERFRPLLCRAWGYYHQEASEYERSLLTIPLLKVSRVFSYDDEGRMKLSRSPRSQQRVMKLLQGDWEGEFSLLLEREIRVLLKRLRESWELSEACPPGVAKGGIDTLTESLKTEHDILITSPPYLQSQEYIRFAKMDLFWLGHSEAEVKRLASLELPYRRVEKVDIHSPTYYEIRERLTEPRMRTIFDSYFHGVIGSLSRLGEQITNRMCVFVGRASMRGIPVPIDRIVAEHMSHDGWEHEVTLVDRIVARRMFSYRVNPATGRTDPRTQSERLVVLRRR